MGGRENGHYCYRLRPEVTLFGLLLCSLPSAPSAASRCFNKLGDLKTKHVPRWFPLEGGD